MGLWNWVGRLTGLSNGLPEFQFDGESAPRPIDQMFAELKYGSGRVSREEALSVPAVQKGRNLICQVGYLPLVQKDAVNNVVRNPLFEQVDPDVANVVTMTQTVEDLLFEAVSWWRVTARGWDGFPSSAMHLEFNTVKVESPSGKTPSPLPSGVDPRAKVVRVNGEIVPWSDIIRFDSPNRAVLTYGASAIRRAILFDRAAKKYAEDPKANEYFTPSDAADPASDPEIEDILSGWRSGDSVRYVPAALTHHTVDWASPADLQLVELQREAALDIARLLGVDPEELGISTTSRTYSNVQDRRVDKINEVLAPYMRAITDRLSMGDVTKRGNRVGFDLDDYLKSNPTERWATYTAAKNLGAMTVEEIRQAEGKPPMPEEDDAPVAPVVSIVPDNVEASQRSAHNFKNQTSHSFSFAAEDPAEFEFSVDSEKRTISGLALPYNKVGMKYGMKFRFRPGSLQYGEVSRVKHYKDHTTPVGKALDLKDTKRALMAKLSVGKGPTGDELLQLAEDGVYDGLSVGVDFNLDPESGDVELMRDGVYDVLRADLREITSTPMPTFDDARMTRVVASRDGGEMDKCATCGQEHAPNVACPTTTPPAVGQTVTMSRDDLTAMVQQLSRNPQGVPEGPAVVNPTRLMASTQVDEAAPYRFDRKGNIMRGSHDFSTDLYAGYNGDATALARATEFVQAQFDVVGSNVASLNPTTNRPEMYVDQREFKYPVWEAISKGTIANNTPFAFPKFNSASGLVANHTEGTEPSSGAFTTTNQTVTPTAVSGKARISRETWDAGGNPQVSALIWRQMVKAWYEALEAFAVATLDAATPTGITLTTGGGTTGQTLDSEITAAFAALQFVRGGFSMDNMFTQVDLYKALIAAKDTTGRRLYPALGPNNASGTVANRFGAIDINGVTAYPSWALAATGSVAASSYLFDSESVHGWATTPERLDFNIEVANVYIGLWGYKAAAISDINGVREVIYDPV
jgi:phage head maturation protease